MTARLEDGRAVNECRTCMHPVQQHAEQNYGHCTAWIVPLVVMCKCQKLDAP